jgi:hypothetical protein
MRGLGRRLAPIAVVAILLVAALPSATVFAATPVAVDFTVASRPYDGTTIATVTGCTLSGIVPPDVVTCDLSSATASFADPAVGTAKPVTGSGFGLGGADAANYEITTVNSSAADITQGVQAITFTSTAPSAAVVGGPTYAVTATGGASGNPVTFTIDAAASAVCSITGAIVSLLAAGTCTIAADQAGDANWNAAPQATQSFAVAAMIVPPPVGLPTLTVTADPKSRPFGVANPPLTATISGFVNGQTLATSGVSGSPACATTATIASPAGTYPITCSPGTLASAAYTFAFAPGVLTVVRGASSVTLSTGTTVFETSTPTTFTAAVEPSVTGAIPTGSLAFTIDGVARPAVPLDVLGRGSVTVSWTTPGVKSVEVAYAGDGSIAEPGTASAAPSVVTNTARATGVGVLGSTFYPIVDRWRDTVTARGIRSERLALSIEVRNAQGTVIRRYAARPAAGAYAWAWNGKTSRGVLAPAGRYTIRQTLIDPYGSRPRRTVTSTVTVSLRTIRWATTTITVSRGPRCFQFSSGDGVGSYSCTSTASLRLAGGAGGWPGVGYAFRLPAAGAYRSIRFEVQGTASGPRPTIGFQDWALGSSWGQLYRSGWDRSAISPTASRWAGVTKVDLGRVVTRRSVRVYVDGGGRLGGPFAFDIARARLVISVGTFE